jgi:hypothetical protein
MPTVRLTVGQSTRVQMRQRKIDIIQQVAISRTSNHM